MANAAHKALTELLVLRTQAGHADAVGLLASLWQDRLWRHARRLTGLEDAASDVAQEAWIAILRGLRRLDDPGKFGPWAYRIVTRTCANWARKRKRRREVERDAESPRAEHEPASGDDVDEVRVALRRLMPEQQLVLHLRYVEEWGIAEIAEAVDVPAGTIKSRLFYARKHLRELIERGRKC